MAEDFRVSRQSPPCRYSQLRITVAKKIQHTKLILIQYSKSPGECQYEVLKNRPRRIAPGAVKVQVFRKGSSRRPRRRSMVFFTALKMFSYPVQRHRWPDSSLRSWSSV